MRTIFFLQVIHKDKGITKLSLDLDSGMTPPLGSQVVISKIAHNSAIGVRVKGLMIDLVQKTNIVQLESVGIEALEKAYGEEWSVRDLAEYGWKIQF